MAIHVVVAGLCRRFTVASFSVALLASAPASADIIIDDFSAVRPVVTPWSMSLTTLSATTLEEFGLRRVLGSVRETEVEASLITGNTDSIHAAIVTSSGGLFEYGSTDGAAGAVRFLYDGNNNLVDNLKGETAIVVDFASLNLAGEKPLTINVFLSDGLHDASHQVLVSRFNPSVALDFDEFRGIKAVNLASIASIRVEFVAPAGTDFQIGLIHTVPTPSTIALMAVAGLVAGRRGRHRAAGRRRARFGQA